MGHQLGLTPQILILSCYSEEAEVSAPGPKSVPEHPGQGPHNQDQPRGQGNPPQAAQHASDEGRPEDEDGEVEARADWLM